MLTYHPPIVLNRGHSHDEQRAISGSLEFLSNLVMAWNTDKIQVLMDFLLIYPARRNCHHRAVVIRYINFCWVLHFPLKEFAVPVLRLRALVRVPVML